MGDFMGIREYIYLDSTYLNSSLAQLGNGLSIGQHQSKSTGSSRTDTDTQEHGKGFNGIFQLSVDLHKRATEQEGITLSRSTEQVIDSVLDDAAIKLLQDKLGTSLIDTPDSANEGDFVKISSTFKVYDFQLLTKALSADNMELLKKQDDRYTHIRSLQEQQRALRTSKNNQQRKLLGMKISAEQSKFDEENGWKNFETMRDAAEFFTNVMPGIILIKMNHTLALCDESMFRENSAQLTQLTNSTRTLTVFGSVTAVTKKRDNAEPFEELPTNGMNVVPEMVTRILLSNFDLLEKDRTLMIRPISISFENSDPD